MKFQEVFDFIKECGFEVDNGAYKERTIHSYIQFKQFKQDEDFIHYELKIETVDKNINTICIEIHFFKEGHFKDYISEIITNTSKKFVIENDVYNAPKEVGIRWEKPIQINYSSDINDAFKIQLLTEIFKCINCVDEEIHRIFYKQKAINSISKVID